MEMYLYILELKKCIHVENFQELQNITDMFTMMSF